MSSARNLQMLARYSAWANARLYDHLLALPPSRLLEPRPGRPHGINGVLAHICAVDLIWKAHLERRDHGFTTRNFDPVPPFEALHRIQQELDTWYIQHADLQGDEALERVVDFRFVDGEAGAMRGGDILLHVFNHRTYHRGYVADMLYDFGVKPPTMDLPVFLRDG